MTKSNANSAGSTLLPQIAIGNKLEWLSEVMKVPGVDVNAGNLNGETPLMGAAQRGHIEMMARLIAYGADVTLKDLDGKSASYFAQQSGKRLQYKADLKRAPKLCVEALTPMPSDALAMVVVPKEVKVCKECGKTRKQGKGKGSSL